jgi:hypothetical protein
MIQFLLFGLFCFALGGVVVGYMVHVRAICLQREEPKTPTFSLNVDFTPDSFDSLRDLIEKDDFKPSFLGGYDPEEH